MPVRDCILCGELTCACQACRSSYSLRSRFGICKTCITGVAKRGGEQSVRHATNEARVRITKTGDPVRTMRARRYLETLPPSPIR